METGLTKDEKYSSIFSKRLHWIECEWWRKVWHIAILKGKTHDIQVVAYFLVFGNNVIGTIVDFNLFRRHVYLFRRHVCLFRRHGDENDNVENDGGRKEKDSCRSLNRV